MPRVRKRKRCVSSNLDEARPRKIASATLPRHMPTTLVTDAPSPPVTPPPRRPCPTPDNPVRIASVPKTPRTVVKDDNTPRRGVKTLDDSVFARILARETKNSPPTPPRAHHGMLKYENTHPQKLPKRPRKPCTISRDSLKHHDPDATTYPAPPPSNQATTHSRDKHIHTTGRQYGNWYSRRTVIAKTTSRPNPGRVSPAYDAIAEHLALCLAKDPDNTRVAQPFTLSFKPSATLRHPKTKTKMK
ncbi:hypothetical protein EDB86DRAFT_2839162 [Lactarius hatsudake]|nr:hypothetical protein EDB86DRAFT_2839162 [Lactarius hatsudake]